MYPDNYEDRLEGVKKLPQENNVKWCCFCGKEGHLSNVCPWRK